MPDRREPYTRFVRVTLYAFALEQPGTGINRLVRSVSKFQLHSKLNIPRRIGAVERAERVAGYGCIESREIGNVKGVEEIGLHP